MEETLLGRDDLEGRPEHGEAGIEELTRGVFRCFSLVFGCVFGAFSRLCHALNRFPIAYLEDFLKMKRWGLFASSFPFSRPILKEYRVLVDTDPRPGSGTRGDVYIQLEAV